MINGVTKLIITKADVLTKFRKINICTSYKIRGENTDELPFEYDAVIEPVYTELEGWNEDISSVRDFDRLPETLRTYINFVEEETKLPVAIVSVGPDRHETIIR